MLGKIGIFISDKEWVILCTAMAGKFFINIPGSMTWIYALELYPTSIRSIGVHVCSFMARVGAVGASYIGILVHIFTYMGVGINLQLSQKIDFAKGILRKCRI